MELYLKESSITLPVSIDWNGDPLRADFRFILQAEEESITFGAKFPKSCFSLGERKQFFEGLWQGSVVELFVHDQNSPAYLEINLSPTGAYWMAEFSDYRVRTTELTEPVEIEIRTFENEIQALLKFECKLLPFSNYTLAQTAILDSSTLLPNQRTFISRRYSLDTSAKEALMSEPDFHKKKLAEPY